MSCQLVSKPLSLAKRLERLCMPFGTRPKHTSGSGSFHRILQLLEETFEVILCSGTVDRLERNVDVSQRIADFADNARSALAIGLRVA